MALKPAEGDIVLGVVEQANGGGRPRWLSAGVGGVSFEIARSIRDVPLGANQFER